MKIHTIVFRLFARSISFNYKTTVICLTITYNRTITIIIDKAMLF